MPLVSRIIYPPLVAHFLLLLGNVKHILMSTGYYYLTPFVLQQGSLNFFFLTLKQSSISSVVKHHLQTEVQKPQSTQTPGPESSKPGTGERKGNCYPQRNIKVGVLKAPF